MGGGTSRRLFCEISPFCYRISYWKCCILRHLRDFLSRESFSSDFCDERLPSLIYRHRSLIRRRLGNVDMELQENKAVNLSLASPCISGILIRPGETFSLWRLVGRTSSAKGYKVGLVISKGAVSRGIGGGLCQLSNLIHWLVLHTPLEVVEHHHHDDIDLFPDYGRQVPFGVGTSISYNYIDYRFKNNTEQTFQLIVFTDDEYLNGELRAETSLDIKYHIQVRNEHFSRSGDIWYREGEVWRSCLDKATGRVVSKELLKKNHARVMYTLDGH